MKTSKEVDFWQARYVQQARWTQSLRAWLYERAGLSAGGRRVLEVGCGTGALLGELTQAYRAQVCGLDINWQALTAANTCLARLLQADAHALPFPTHVFDACLCHFLLLWVRQPLQVLTEMRRVTRPGGYVLALAEPDYGGRIDFPDDLVQLGEWQTQALRRQGADPLLGRGLHALMLRAGLHQVETGVLGGAWGKPADPADRQLEWQVLEEDLKDFVPCDTIKQFRCRDEEAWQSGGRILFVPTFYSIGQV